MRKVLKIILTTVILAMFFYNASFAAGLGEKEGGAVVVAIYKNNTYVALSVTTEALANGQILEWNKWSSQDLITLYNRCSRGNVKFYNDKQKYTWYINYQEEFKKRIDNKQIIAVGANSSNFSGFNSEGEPIHDDLIEYKVSTDMTEDDKNRADEYDKQQEVKDGTSSQQSDIQTKPIQKPQDKIGSSRSGTSINPDDYKPRSLDHTNDAEELEKIGNIIIGYIQAIGSIASVAVLGVLGIKYMIGSAEEKAEYKKSIRPYIIGAVMVFAITNILGILVPIAQNLFGNI